MGCTVSLVKPEHEILDICIEICRLAYSTGVTTEILSVQLASNLSNIVTVAERCTVLPQYCLREVRHGVETMNHKQPLIGKSLDEISQYTLNAVRKKSIGIVAPYKCAESPNEGSFNLKFNFFFPEDALNELRKPEFLDFKKPTTTPQCSNVSSIVQTPRKAPVMTSEKKNNPPASPVILRTLEGSISSDEENNSVTDYGFYHEEDQMVVLKPAPDIYHRHLYP